MSTGDRGTEESEEDADEEEGSEDEIKVTFFLEEEAVGPAFEDEGLEDLVFLLGAIEAEPQNYGFRFQKVQRDETNQRIWRGELADERESETGFSVI